MCTQGDAGLDSGVIGAYACLAPSPVAVRILASNLALFEQNAAASIPDASKQLFLNFGRRTTKPFVIAHDEPSSASTFDGSHGLCEGSTALKGRIECGDVDTNVDDTEAVAMSLLLKLGLLLSGSILILALTFGTDAADSHAKLSALQSAATPCIRKRVIDYGSMNRRWKR